MSGGDFYHCRLKAFGRSSGRSAVQCAAYRAGMALHDERYGVLRDFSRKPVVTTFTIAPDDAPDWARDVTQLWNRVEAFEKRKDSQLAYEWEISLPHHELDDAQRENIARNFASWLVDEYGVAVTVGIHSGEGRGNGLNDHAHIQMTRRGVNENGFERKILPQFSTNPRADNPEVTRVRKQVADIINQELEDAGSHTRVDSESYAARGIDKEPTKHLGPGATAYERQGMDTDRGSINREIMEERLRWQRDEAEPQILAELARQFGEAPKLTDAVAQDIAARFGDWTERAPEPPKQAAEAAAGPPADWREAKPGEGASQLPEHTAWERFANRMRSFRALALELLRDETSGRPEGERGLLARALDTTRELWKGLRWGNHQALMDGLQGAEALAHDFGSHAADDKDAHAPPEHGREPARPGANVESPEPDERPQQGAAAKVDAGDSFARWLEQLQHEPEPEPDTPEPEAQEPRGPDIE